MKMDSNLLVVFVMCVFILGGFFGGCITSQTKNPDGSITTVTSVDTQAIVNLAPVALQLSTEIANIAEQIKTENDAAKQAALQAKQAQMQQNLNAIMTIIGKAPLSAPSVAKLIKK